jgi:hypothetical protein
LIEETRGCDTYTIVVCITVVCGAVSVEVVDEVVDCEGAVVWDVLDG